MSSIVNINTKRGGSNVFDDVLGVLSCINDKEFLKINDQQGLCIAESTAISRNNIQTMISMVYPLKLRLKLQREWLNKDTPARDSGSFYQRHIDIFEPLVEQLKAKKN